MRERDISGNTASQQIGQLGFEPSTRGLQKFPQRGVAASSISENPTGALSKLKSMWRRNKPSDNGTDLVPGALQTVSHLGPDKATHKEEELPEKIRPITPEDVQTMVDGGWFEDWNRIKGLKGDVINETTIPSTWTTESRKKFKAEVLMPFYFPPGRVEHIVAKDEKGNVIREVDVARQTMVLDWKGKLKASRSFMDQDPWATPTDYAKFKMAHAQMFIVAPGEEGNGFGRGLAAHTHKEVFKQGYNQIITWVNMEGIDYGVQEQFFKSMGYTEERRRSGLVEVTIAATGEKHMIRQYRLTEKNKNANLATDKNPWIIWERTKARLEREETRQNGGR